MNKDTLSGNWKILKGKIKQKWAKLTDDDVTYIEGSYDKLAGRLQKHYGYKQDQIDKEISEFCKPYEKEKTF